MPMKRVYLGILLILSLLATSPLKAEKVGRDRALEAARTFFQYDRARSPRRVVLHELPFAPQTKAAADPAFYVFEREGGGFVIVAGDDRCRPVLGYSFTRPFVDPAAMPESLREWLDDYQEQVDLIRNEDLPATPAAMLAWASLETPTKAGTGGFEPAHKLETPVWGQGEPFNNLAPMVNGKRAVAGCVPLAMSMICRFFSYPERGTGELPSYSYTADDEKTYTIEGFALGHAYAWDKMKMDYSTSYTPEEAEAVSRLVYDCGVMVEAKYDTSTSSTTGNMVRQAIDHLGFDAGAVMENRGFYDDAVWTEKLKAELMLRPVLYSARREGDYGHTFLLDGYDERDYFSINWGWAGGSNGYYALSAFAPSEKRAYIFKHAAVFGLQPDAGGVGTSYLYLRSGTATSGTVYVGLEPKGPIVPRKPFVMNVGGIANGGNSPYSGYFILALTDADDQIRDFVCGSQYYAETNPRSWRGYKDISCVLPVYPRSGDKIKLFYCSEDESVQNPTPWKPVLWDRTDEVVAEIPVFDTQTLSDVTSLLYSKTSGLMTISTKDGVDWTLSGADASVVQAAVKYVGTELYIDTSLLPKGSYTLSLVRGKDKLELRLKMGWK